MSDYQHVGIAQLLRAQVRGIFGLADCDAGLAAIKGSDKVRSLARVGSPTVTLNVSRLTKANKIEVFAPSKKFDLCLM